MFVDVAAPAAALSTAAATRERDKREKICVCGARQYTTATAMFNIIHLFVYSRHFIQPYPRRVEPIQSLLAGPAYSPVGMMPGSSFPSSYRIVINNITMR